LNRAERAAAASGHHRGALDEFIARGFAATRLDDRQARRRRQGTSIAFKDKESMFEELILTAIVPLIGRMHAPPPSAARFAIAVETFAKVFIEEWRDRRGDIVRVIVSEGRAFPAIADFYYREVVSRGLAGCARLSKWARAREIKQKSLRGFRNPVARR